MSQQLEVKSMVKRIGRGYVVLGMTGTSAVCNRQFRMYFVDSIEPVTQCL